MIRAALVMLMLSASVHAADRPPMPVAASTRPPMPVGPPVEAKPEPVVAPSPTIQFCPDGKCPTQNVQSRGWRWRR